MRRWSADARATGAFVIADEIQCGLRRCGPVSVSVAAGARPDAVLFGKPLGGGVMPLSAVVCTPDLFAPLVADPFFHTTTFGAHPASCAAGLAALDLLDTLDHRFDVTGAWLAGILGEIATAHPDLIVDAHAVGLFGALTFASETLAGLAILDAGRRGLLLAQCLTAPSVVRLLPPVVTSRRQMTTAGEILDASCRALRRRTTVLSGTPAGPRPAPGAALKPGDQRA
jgi:putrescine aminotransferase